VHFDDETHTPTQGMPYSNNPRSGGSQMSKEVRSSKRGIMASQGSKSYLNNSVENNDRYSRDDYGKYTQSDKKQAEQIKQQQ